MLTWIALTVLGIVSLPASVMTARHVNARRRLARRRRCLARIDRLEAELRVGSYSAPYEVSVEREGADVVVLDSIIGHPEYVAHALSVGLISTAHAIIRLQTIGYSPDQARAYLEAYAVRIGRTNYRA